MHAERKQILDRKISDRYQTDFSSGSVSWVENNKRRQNGIEIPHGSNIDEVLIGAQKVSFVEDIHGGPLNLKLIVDREYSRPDQDGTYVVREVYAIRDGLWHSESTLLDIQDNPLVDRIGSAICISKEEAIRDQLGPEFSQRYEVADINNKAERNSWREWGDLYRFAPKHSTVRLIENVQVFDPRRIFKDELGVFQDRFGEEALAQYLHASATPYNFFATKVEGTREPNDLPGTEIIRKSGPWSMKDNFYYVRWIDENKDKFVYACPQHNEKNGFAFDFLEVYIPKYDKEGELVDFSIEYLYYKPQHVEEISNVERCFVVEQDFGRTRVTQVLRPMTEEGSRSGDFENILLLFEDSESGKTMNVNAVYPELRIVSSYKGTRGVLGSAGNPAFPIMNIGLVTQDYGKLIGHEQTHFDTYHSALRKGVSASVLSRTDSNPFYLNYLVTAEGLPFVISSLNSSMVPLQENPEWGWGFYGAFLLAGNIFFGETPYRHILTEEAAEHGGRMFVLSTREHGVDMLNGVPQGRIQFAPDTPLWNAVKSGAWVITRPSASFSSYRKNKSVDCQR